MVSMGQWPHWTEQFRGERPSDDPGKLEVWGYTSRPSYAPGELLELHVSTTAENFSVEIYRDGASLELVHREEGIPGAFHPTPADAYATGCDWPVAQLIEIPEGWRSGGYVLVFTASDERGSVMQDGFFIVRAPRPAEHGTAFVVATYTWQEYNDWGGACGYASADGFAAPRPGVEDDHGSARGTSGFAPRLAFQRPWGRGLIRIPRGAPRIPVRGAPEIGWAPRYEVAEWAWANGFSVWSMSAGWARFDGLFARWAERNGYSLDFLSQWDLDRSPDALDGYDCVVTVGHDEYWTAAGRAVLDRFVEAGGGYARLAGNIFWQVRLEDDGGTQVCYKYVPEDDPLGDSSDVGLRTGPFEYSGIARPPVTTFGANGGRGVYAKYGGMSPRGVGGFVVYRNDHWAFAGTDLYYGDVLGADVPLVAYESDGVSYTFRNGLPYPAGDDGSPAELEILALTPVSFEEEDHGHPGAVLLVRDADLAVMARLFFGGDTAENRERLRAGSAVITHMPKGAGEVLCCGTTEWPYALDRGEPMVECITRNVLDRFGAHSRFDAPGREETA